MLKIGIISNNASIDDIIQLLDTESFTISGIYSNEKIISNIKNIPIFETDYALTKASNWIYIGHTEYTDVITRLVKLCTSIIIERRLLMNYAFCKHIVQLHLEAENTIKIHHSIYSYNWIYQTKTYISKPILISVHRIYTASKTDPYTDMHYDLDWILKLCKASVKQISVHGSFHKQYFSLSIQLISKNNIKIELLYNNIHRKPVEQAYILGETHSGCIDFKTKQIDYFSTEKGRIKTPISTSSIHLTHITQDIVNIEDVLDTCEILHEIQNKVQHVTT